METTPALTADQITASASVPPRRRRLRRAVMAAAALAVAGATVVGAASGASADTSAAARSFGMQCSAQYGWVRENYPNISVATTANQTVYWMVTLQQYAGGQWVPVRTSSWFIGVSNVTGRKALGSFGQPYYFAISTSMGTAVGPERGPAFTGLGAGYYRTVETYWVNGTSWSAYGYDVDSSTSSQWCYA